MIFLILSKIAYTKFSEGPTPNPLVDYIVLCTATILLNKDYPIGTYILYAFLFISALLDFTAKEKKRWIGLHWSIISILSILILLYFQNNI